METNIINSTMLAAYFSIKRWKLFSAIVMINLLIILLSQISLISETVFFNTYSEQLTFERSKELFTRMKSLSWISYLITPVFLTIKFSVISLVIFIGVFFCDMQKEITLGKIFTVVIACEAVFVVASMVKLIWFIFFAGNYTLNDLSFFYPLSLINLFKLSDVASYWIYPLQTVNLFQVIYILMLAAGLAKVSTINRNSADKIILATYVPAITLWIVFVVFMTIDVPA